MCVCVCVCVCAVRLNTISLPPLTTIANFFAFYFSANLDAAADKTTQLEQQV